MSMLWNPLDKSKDITLSNGDTTATSTATGWDAVRSLSSKNSGKWYYEVQMKNITGGAYHLVGMGTSSANINNFPGSDANGWGYHVVDGKAWHSGTSKAWQNIATKYVNDVIQVAVDMDTGRIYFGYNNTWLNSSDPVAGTNPAYTNLSGDVYPMIGLSLANLSSTISSVYSPPSGYTYWSDAPTTYTVTYDGNNNTSGTVPTDSNEYSTDDTVTVLGNTGSLAKTGYTFNGWNTAADGSGTSYAASATFSMGSANVTLYAVWAAPTLSTAAATSVTLSSATLNGSLDDMGESSSVDVRFDYGTSETVLDQKTATQTLTATGSFSANITGLAQGETYYFRAVGAETP